MVSLSRREQDLLHRYQQFYLALVEGRRLPPVTEHERLWVRWRRMTRDRNVRVIMRLMGPDDPPGRADAYYPG
jgi:uncharacterized protein YifE (UPF0438 family)